jgi:hypothetical protein
MIAPFLVISSLFETARIPSYATEADAVRGFMHMVRYRETIDQLMATPPNVSEHFTPNTAAARQIAALAMADGRTWLDPIEIADLLGTYGIAIVPALVARTPDEAATAAAPLVAKGSAVVIKILSPDIVHKSDVGGVRLNLTSQGAVRDAAAEILAKARAALPNEDLQAAQGRDAGAMTNKPVDLDQEVSAQSVAIQKMRLSAKLALLKYAAYRRKISFTARRADQEPGGERRRVLCSKDSHTLRHSFGRLIRYRDSSCT